MALLSADEVATQIFDETQCHAWLCCASQIFADLGKLIGHWTCASACRASERVWPYIFATGAAST